MKRFAHLSDEQIANKRAAVTPSNTKKANEKAARTFRAYLKEAGKSENFEEFTEGELDASLGKFYINARQADGSMYKISSLENFRHSLNRFLIGPPHSKKFDICKDLEFRESNELFKTAKMELKSKGFGFVEHFPAINDHDLMKMYNSQAVLGENPRSLQNKVQLDIRLYFCRRGEENMHSMTKSFFQTKMDPESGLKYVIKCSDERQKNHKDDDKEFFSGLMCEMPGSPICPVTSYLKYMQKLHPACDSLWPRPLEKFAINQSIWYYKKPVGERKLNTFMKTLSRECELSQIYTNHSLRVTGSTILGRNKCSDAQMMSVTGHKSVSSLSLYQRETNREKIEMSHFIAGAITGNGPWPQGKIIGQ